MHYKNLIPSCIFIIISGMISAEQFVKFNYRVKSCPKENWYICKFKRERICTAKGGNIKFLCATGDFYEEFNNCSYYELSKDFCDGGYQFKRFVQFCDGKCSDRHEKIQYQCQSNPACSKIAHRRCSCGGKIAEWCQWSSYSECSASCGGGVKTKVRYKCRDRIYGKVSSDCGSKVFNETYSTQCNTFPCNWITPAFLTTTSYTTTTTTSKAITTRSVTDRNIVPTCDGICDIYLNDDVDIGHACSKTVTCNSHQNVILSCGNKPSCEHPSSSVCPIYRRWTSWSIWNVSSATQRRYRYQVCHHSMSEDKNSCQKEAMLQTECKSARRQPQWIIWLVIGLVAVVALLCCCGVLCFCFGKRRRRSKRMEQANGSASNGADDVFIQSDRTQVTDSGPSNKLGIMNRLERISEHLYEAISGQSARIRSRLSTAGDSRRSTKKDISQRSSNGQLPIDKVENEYIGNDASFRSHDQNGGLQLQNYNPGEQSRVSVFITDPDGREVFKDDNDQIPSTQLTLPPFPTAGTNPIDYVEMNQDSRSDRSYKSYSSSSAVQEKTQWERVPSPPSHESPKPSFFQRHSEDQVLHSMERDLNLEVSVPRPTGTSDVDDSAPWSAVDNVSMWSESSFESVNYSDGEAYDQYTPEKLSHRHASDRSLHFQSGENESSKASGNVGYLAPGKLSVVQYLSPRPGNPVKQKMKPPSSEEKSQSQEMLGTYLRMSDDRATVKSWLNLGAAPVPNSSNAMKQDDSYCDANDLNGKQFRDVKLKKLSREQSLDEKYTTTDYPRLLATNPTNQTLRNDIPVDTEGYFNVNYPAALPRRLNTAVAREAAKNAIRAPFPK